MSGILPHLLSDMYTYVLNNVAVIANEEISATVLEIDLHANQSVGVPRQMVQCDALAEVEGSLIESLPITTVKSASDISSILELHLQVELQIVLQIHANICAGCYRPEGGTKF